MSETLQQGGETAMNRAEHLAWSKKRAIEAMERGTPASAWESIISDMNKHEELRNNASLALGHQMFQTGNLNTPEAMRRFIEGII